MTAHKKAWVILTVLLAIELVPFTMTLALSPHGVARKLYGFDRSDWVAWVAALAFTVAYVAYAARAFPLIREKLFTLNSMKLAAVAFAIITGTVEELYFRKFIMDWGAHHSVATIGQVALSAIVFGAAHGVWGIFAKQWRMAFGAALATGILGGLLAIVYLLAGRHVAPCVWAHMLINLAIEPWLILAAASGGLRNKPASQGA